MKIDYKKIFLVLVSCLMVLSLIIASCGTKETDKEQDGYRDPDEPKYGGTMTFAWFEPQGWDPYYTFMVSCSTLYVVNEELLMGDWSKTPAGDGSAGIGGFLGYASRLTGDLAESWSMPDEDTLLYNIRQGVHWQNKPPVNGREYDAYDAAWAINRLTSAPTGAHRMISPPEEYILGATALDKWTVEVKVPPEAQGLQAIYVGSWLYHYPKEVVDTYGDMKDWKNVVGTGPYMLQDYITGSVLTFERNPNYWQHDPIHPKNQLPYLDELKWMIIGDASTQLAAFRTGQVDISYGLAINTEDSKTLINENPELHYVTLPGGFDAHLYFRVDKPELPWKDTRVRQAMTLCINKQELIDDYYGGDANLLGAVYPPDKAWEPFYTPLEKQPTKPTTPDSRCGVQELFTFDETTIPKAKALLAEAGYPNGFKCQIISSSPAQTDFLSIIKEYFSVVNVELEIQQLEGSIVGGMRRSRSYEEGIYTASPTAAFPYDMHSTRIESFDCFSYYEHPKTRAAYEEQRKYVMKDDVKYASTLKEITPFILEQCVGIWCPVPRSYRMWWPWVQNYHGESSLGCDDQLQIYWYMWIDEEMKLGMGY
ncbi:MAG TPA: ABC transporter substrate-binding protein [Dehalococcoidia bacterium]|nr:ABC transporter substrate-binding protein [Dehalococcoidia bacterium]